MKNWILLLLILVSLAVAFQVYTGVHNLIDKGPWDPSPILPIWHALLKTIDFVFCVHVCSVGWSTLRNPLILVLMAGAAAAIWYVWLPLPVALVPVFFQTPVAVRGASPLIMAAPEAHSRRLSDQYAQYAILATTPRSSTLVVAPRGASALPSKLLIDNPLQQRLLEPAVDFK